MSHSNKHFNKYGSCTARAKGIKIKHDTVESESKLVQKHMVLNEQYKEQNVI